METDFGYVGYVGYVGYMHVGYKTKLSMSNPTRSFIGVVFDG